jgi:2-polyprenyl-3-methyl-5-hydroxy-6-metoxy-1,4-benzoquinol methylase
VPRPSRVGNANDAKLARAYFDSFADDYQRAFTGGGRRPLHAVINRLFRRRTFVSRTEVVMGFLRDLELQGKTVLDVGCGTGEVSIAAARAGAARVIGMDIAPRMIDLASQAAAATDVRDRIEFRQQDILTTDSPPCDIALLIGVIEYYGDLDGLIARIAPHVRQAFVIADTRGPLWRRGLRYLLARVKHFHVYYRDPDQVRDAMRQWDFDEDRRLLGHSFTVTRHRRR